MVYLKQVGIGDGLRSCRVGGSGRGHYRAKDLAVVWSPGTGHLGLCFVSSHHVWGLSFPTLTWGFGAYLLGIATE